MDTRYPPAGAQATGFGGAQIGYGEDMRDGTEHPEIARPTTPDPGRAGHDSLYDPGEGRPPEDVDDAEDTGQRVIGEQRERRRE
ncbi:hypothetical protein AB0F91_44490 [Amycolatopsis sp. NPDC023774]|uniref:hypothetical protein n=1 Tax=Amycolatopsis sp. NPDC023774 TaxID=3155015 RepID=UPI0033C51000